MARSGQQLHQSVVLLLRAHCALHSAHGVSLPAAAHRHTHGGVPAHRCLCSSHNSMSGADMEVTDIGKASHPQHQRDDPLAATRQLLLSLQLPDGHSHSRLLVARRLIDIFQRAGLPVTNQPLTSTTETAAAAAADPEAQAKAAASAVARCVEDGLRMAAGTDHEQWRWVAAGLPELLQLHARLGVPQSPELGEGLARLLAAGHLYRGSSSSWNGNTASSGASPGAIAAAEARAEAGAAHRAGASTAGDTTRTAGGAVAEACTKNAAGEQHYSQQLPQHQQPHHAPAILRWAAAMAAVPVSNHEAWRLLASSPLLHQLQLNPHAHLRHDHQQQPPPSVRAIPGSIAWESPQPPSYHVRLGPSAKPLVPPLLAGLTPDQLALLLSSYARAGYHPVEVLR